MERFARDNRILVLDNISQFSLSRAFHGSMLCPYDPLTQAQRDDILSFAREKIAGREMYDADDSLDPLYPETWCDLLGRYPEGLDILKNDLREIYNQLSGKDATTASLRVNSTNPSWPHAHSELAIIYTLCGSGSIGYDRNERAYATPPRHVFAIAPDFMHAAPAGLAPGELRITLALSRPEL